MSHGQVPASPPLLPGALEIPLGGRRIRKIDILWALLSGGGGNVARVTVTANDGTRADLRIDCLFQVLPLEDHSFLEALPRVWEGNLACQANAALHRWEWANPHPGQPLRELRIVSRGTPALPLVLAITVQLEE